MNLSKCLLLLLFLLPFITNGQEASVYGEVRNVEQQLLEGVSIYLESRGKIIETDEKGDFRFDDLKDGKHQLIFYAEGFTTLTQEALIANGQNVMMNIELDSLQFNLEAIEVEAEKREAYGLRSLRNVEGMAIYAAKKSEVILMSNLVANLATNNPRQVYKGIPGLNIWENDGAGLQLSIGARGLDPNRTSNFNTRQNGYDISADALGYPESYYTPPTQALQRIEIVRGAASLQYGPQFGGLLNFVMKKGKPNKPIEWVSETTVGSFGLKTSFNSLGGSKDGWNYYTFYQRKQGDGWRGNSKFHQNNAYLSVSKKISPKLKLGFEYTFMNYLAQQPGGLQDFEFRQDARQSNRSRNWFKVNWNLAALILDYRLSEKTRLNSRSFFLGASRQALGELGPINRPDPLRERDLVSGSYRNFGNETRLIHRYEIGNQLATFLIGSRYYQGHSHSRQGDASDGSDADFSFLNPNDLERSDYKFPSRNISLFAENLFNINNRWSITPGIRYEYIRTASEGSYKKRVFSGGQVIFEQRFESAKENNRSLLLLGIGTGFKIKPTVEAYANISQNYRSINFSDLAVVNPNLVVDSLLKDERGFNIDMGLRGSLFKDIVRFDASLFYLRYRDRIGVGELVVPDPAVIERVVAFTTNIGNANIYGLETYVEGDVWKLINGLQSELGLSVFVNFSMLEGKYSSGRSAFVGNDVELIPPFTLKTGFNLRYKNIKASYQFSQVGSHFSDATNAEFVVDASRGTVPSYAVQDVSLSYQIERFCLQGGVNNLLDERYFTRRSAAYPGPGIIPADGRSFYFGLGWRW